MSAPRKLKILELKKKYAHVMLILHNAANELCNVMWKVNIIYSVTETN